MVEIVDTREKLETFPRESDPEIAGGLATLGKAGARLDRSRAIEPRPLGAGSTKMSRS